MKRNNINITQPVAFELSTAELPHFVVEGSYEDVSAVHAEMAQTMPVSDTPAAPRLVEASAFVTKAAHAVLGGIALDIKAKSYDMLNGTHFLPALREKRQLAKDLRMAQSLGLLTVDVCAKHRKALDAVKKVR